MKKNYLFLVGIGALLAMSSCSKDEDLTAVKEGKNATLTLKLKGTSVDTRVVGSVGLEADNVITSVTIGVFKPDGSVDAIETVDVTNTTTEVVNCTSGERDVVFVANPSSVDVGLLEATINKDKFNEVLLSLIDRPQNDLKPLMTGNQHYSLNAGENSGKNIDATRLVGRVQLTSLMTAFIPQYVNATLKIDEIFLHNASFKNSVDNLLPILKDLYTGWLKERPSSYSLPYSAGLTNSPTSPETIFYPLTNGSTDNVIPANAYHYFYTFPNMFATNATDFSSATKLVISGMFDLDGDAGPTLPYRVYYPIVVNKEVKADSHTGIGVERNYIYSLGAKILRPGVTNPDTPIDPASISLTIAVTNWSSLSQTNDF